MINDCWNRIGVSGDRSCPELERFVHCRNCPVFASAARTFFERPAPEGYLADWGRLLSDHAIDHAVGASASVIIFRLRDEWLALATKAVVEVTRVQPVHGIPHRSNSILTGLVNQRGQLYLCVSLHGLLGLEVMAGSRAANPRMVIIQQNAEHWVFTADEVLGVQRVPVDLLRNVPSTLANLEVSFSQAVFVWEGRSVGYLDEERVFAGLRSMGQ